MFCIKCGKELKSNYRFCPKCGYELNEMYLDNNKGNLSVKKLTELRANIFNVFDALGDQKVRVFNNELQAQIANGEKVPLFYPTIKSLIGNSKRVFVEFRTFNTIRLIVFNFGFPNQRVAKGELYMLIIAFNNSTNKTRIFEIYNENDKDGLVIEFDSSNKKSGSELVVKLNNNSMIRSIFGVLEIKNIDNLLITKEQKNTY